MATTNLTAEYSNERVELNWNAGKVVLTTGATPDRAVIYPAVDGAPDRVIIDDEPICAAEIERARDASFQISKLLRTLSGDARFLGEARDLPAATYYYRVRTRNRPDAAFGAWSNTVSVAAIAKPIVFRSPRSLPFVYGSAESAGVPIGQSFTYQLIATGGTGDRQWSIDTGSSLPPGMNLSPGGVLSGAPTTGGEFNFVVKIADAANNSLLVYLTFTVVHPNQLSPVIDTATLPQAFSGVFYSETLTASEAPAPFQWFAVGGEMPPGLSLGRFTGIISGFPNDPRGTFPIEFEARGANGKHTRKVLSILVLRGYSAADITGYSSAHLLPRDLEILSLPNSQSLANNAAMPELIDYSGKNRHPKVATGELAPQYFATHLAGKGVVWFDSANGFKPFKTSGALHLKHIFAVCSVNAATFSQDRGLLSDTDPANALLLGLTGTTKFYDLSGFYAGYSYRKDGVLFADNNQQAPVSSAFPNKFAIVELQFPAGANLSGLQIGQDRNDAARRWEGGLAFLAAANRILSETERAKIYEFLNLNLPNPIVFATNTLPSGVRGAFYSAQLNVSGGGAPVRFRVTTPSDGNTGLEVDSNYVLRGVPRFGLTSVRIEAYDVAGQSVVKNFAFSIAGDADFETLDLTHFTLTEHAVSVAKLVANFGDGYGAAARVGSAAGLRRWAIETQVVPDLPEYLIENQTRFNYLWEFYLRHGANEIFAIRDFRTNKLFHASFEQDELSFEAFTSLIYGNGSGLTIKQRRARGRNYLAADGSCADLG